MMLNRSKSLSSPRAAVKHQRRAANAVAASLPRFVAAAVIAAACCGCDFFAAPEAAAPTPPPTIPDSQRPPLRVAVSSRYGGLAESLERRWATVSEQALEVVDADDLLSGQRAQTDVWIMPAMTLATLVERGLVTPLPDAAGGPGRSAGGDAEAAPLGAAWLKSATYAQRLYGRPLGLSLILAQPHLDADLRRMPVNAAETSSGGSTDGSAGMRRAVIVDWQRVASAAFGSLEHAYPPDEVDFFLAIAATERPRAYEASLLFTELGFEPRLQEPWMIKSAAATAAYLRRSGVAGDEDAAGGKGVVELRVGWGAEAAAVGASGAAWLPLATPQAAGPSNAQQEVAPENRAVAVAEVDIAKLAAVDGGHAPIVLLSASTRQSARSLFFLKWFDEPGVIEAVAGELPWVMPADAAAAEGSYRRTVLRLSDIRELPVAFAVPEALKYREALLAELRSLTEASGEGDAAAAMRRCAAAWEAITEEAGRGEQEAALARSLGLDR